MKKRKVELCLWSPFFLSPVFNAHLLPFLPVVDYMSLVRAVPGLRSKWAKPYALFEQRLEQFLLAQNVAPGFVHYIVGELGSKQSQVQLTGSLVLFLLTEADLSAWSKAPVHDIDLVVSKVHRLDYDLWKAYGLSWAGRGDPLVEAQESKDNPLYDNQLLSKVQDRYLPHVALKVQLLCVNRKKTIDYIQSFDLSFCSNVVGDGQLRLLYPEDVLKRAMENPIQLYETYFPKNAYEPLNLFHNYLPKRFFRLKKYAERGFDFTCTNYKESDILDQESNTFVYSEDQKATYPYLAKATREALSHRGGVLVGMWFTFWNMCLTKRGKLKTGVDLSWK